MSNLFDFLDDEPEPNGEPDPSKTPTWHSHLCGADGCREEGGFGYFSGDIRTSTWRCWKHLWPGFLPGDRP